MTKSMWKILYLEIAIVLIVLSSALWFALNKNLVFNTTASYPIGIYALTFLSSETNLTQLKGQLVVACPPNDYNYTDLLPKGECPSGTGTILKRVVGSAGDEIRVDKEVYLNDTHLTKSNVYPKTQSGRVLESCQGSVKLKEGQVWLMSEYNRRSFDSRYFCSVPKSNIISLAKAYFVYN